MDSNWSAFFVPLLLAWICWSTFTLDRRMQALEQSLSALLRHFNVDPLSFAAPSARVKELAMDPARRIEAMRVYRQETGADLRTAKSVIDNLAAGR